MSNGGVTNALPNTISIAEWQQTTSFVTHGNKKLNRSASTAITRNNSYRCDIIVLECSRIFRAAVAFREITEVARSRMRNRPLSRKRKRRVASLCTRLRIRIWWLSSRVLGTSRRAADRDAKGMDHRKLRESLSVAKFFSHGFYAREGNQERNGNQSQPSANDERIPLGRYVSYEMKPLELEQETHSRGTIT